MTKNEKWLLNNDTFVIIINQMIQIYGEKPAERRIEKFLSDKKAWIETYKPFCDIIYALMDNNIL